MITTEELQKALKDDNQPFRTKNIDHDFVAIALLRERIPYDECKSIIKGADHDIIYLCYADIVIKYLTPDDLNTLADCNVCYDEDNDSLFLFV